MSDTENTEQGTTDDLDDAEGHGRRIPSSDDLDDAEGHGRRVPPREDDPQRGEDDADGHVWRRGGS